MSGLNATALYERYDGKSDIVSYLNTTAQLLMQRSEGWAKYANLAHLPGGTPAAAHFQTKSDIVSVLNATALHELAAPSTPDIRDLIKKEPIMGANSHASKTMTYSVTPPIRNR
ncbi:MAG TPA: hypothetical protein VGM83_05740 [Devosiaceae bacterium]